MDLRLLAPASSRYQFQRNSLAWCIKQRRRPGQQLEYAERYLREFGKRDGYANLFSKSNLNLALDSITARMSTNTGGIIVNNWDKYPATPGLAHRHSMLPGATFNKCCLRRVECQWMNFFWCQHQWINNSGTINATGSTIFSSSAVNSLAFTILAWWLLEPSSGRHYLRQRAGNNGTFTNGDRLI